MNLCQPLKVHNDIYIYILWVTLLNRKGLLGVLFKNDETEHLEPLISPVWLQSEEKASNGFSNSFQQTSLEAGVWLLLFESLLLLPHRKKSSSYLSRTNTGSRQLFQSLLDL